MSNNRIASKPRAQQTEWGHLYGSVGREERCACIYYLRNFNIMLGIQATVFVDLKVGFPLWSNNLVALLRNTELRFEVIKSPTLGRITTGAYSLGKCDFREVDGALA
jgi:hypothetical protein